MLSQSVIAFVRSALLAILAFASCVRADCTPVPSDRWRTTFTIPDSAWNDPFVANAPANGEPHWVKFTILLCDPGTVYFQNSRVLPFHYKFATTLLNPFLGMSAPAFDAVSLRAAGQQAVLGAVLLAPDGRREFAVQLVRQDAYNREQAAQYINLVRSKITNAGQYAAFYMPTYEQATAANAQAAFFAANGTPISSTSRWAPPFSNPVYAQGWALGTLKYFPAAQVRDAYNSGALRPEDILLIDAVPAELPFVAGIVSLSPATPSSHVAILSQTYNTPMLHLRVAEDAAAAQSLVGRRVLVRAYEGAASFGFTFPNAIDVVDASMLTPAQAAEVLSLKNPGGLQIAPMQRVGAYFLDVDPLTPPFISRVGGKAANYGVLRRSIPGNARKSLALTFDLWQDYMSQTLSNGRTLREEINARLAPHTWPPNFQALSNDLAAIRALFTSTSQTTFSPALQNAVVQALQNPTFGLDRNVKIRFRSSTNVEDAANFTGAGLYDSFSGCLADDLDADTIGPSICDPLEANERGVFRAIRRVYASFYNDNAYLQRLRFGINENNVGMAMLVHHSYPDPTELANGVAIITRNDANYSTITITTQTGAWSVTNPEPGQSPEVVRCEVYNASMDVRRVQDSNMVQLGAGVMTWDADYRALAQLLLQIASRYQTENSPAFPYALDVEFKKTTVDGPAGKLEIKQVRPLPLPSNTPSITPYMLGTPQDYRTYQGEFSPILANHRHKMTLTITPKSQWLTSTNVANGLIDRIAGEFDLGCQSLRIDAPVASLPGYAHQTLPGRFGLDSRTSWRVPDAANPRTYTLSLAQVPSLVAPSRCPVLLLSDFGEGTSGAHRVLSMVVLYDQPVPVLQQFPRQIVMSNAEGIALGNAREIAPVSDSIVDFPVSPNGSVSATLKWASPRGAAAGYTAPISDHGPSTVSGVLPTVLSLVSRESQSASPHHHNFGLTMLFEPRRDPGVTARQRRELRRMSADYILIDGGSAFGSTPLLVGDPCPMCIADVDDGRSTGVPDGGVTIEDLLYFLLRFGEGSVEADVDNGSGGGAIDDAVTIEDLLYFLGRFGGGC